MSSPDALGIGDFKVQLDDEVASGVAAKVARRGRLHRPQRCAAAHLRQPGRVLRTPGITAIPELKEGYVHG
jgi:hypothetical protein